ncbi:MAG: glutathione S-transferase family protein [Alphaproteobacteria bacterium]
MYRLYTRPSTAGMAPHILLHEIGAPHELVALDKDAGALTAPDYAKLNPHARVPTLVEGDLVIYEATAICLHLADRHPEAGLAPALGSDERARFYQWMAFLTNSVQADEMIWFYPERFAPESEAAAVRAKITDRLAQMFAVLDKAVAGRQWLAGDRFGAADAYLFMLARWTRNMPRKARDLPYLGPYLARVLDRPSVRAMIAAEGLSEPFY